MAAYLPIYKPGQAITLKASAAITGRQVVAVSGSGTVAPAGANSTAVVGVAAFDVATNDNVTIYAGGVQECTAASAVTAGDLIAAAAGGKVAKAATADRTVIGVALTTAATDAPVRVQFDR